jgi:integral membrane sensor domain MASE1
VRTTLNILAVTAAYVAFAGLSALLAYADTDAWAVWLASGVPLGLLLSRPRSRWGEILAGAALGAVIFGMLTASGFADSLGYGLVEVVSLLAGVWAASWIAELPLRLDRPRELTALALGGALAAAITGGAMIALWNVLASASPGGFTFRVWTLSSAAGSLLVAPLIISWQQFRVKRSGGLPMRAFIGGLIASLLFLAAIAVVFAARDRTSFVAELTYLPLVFMAIIAQLWGTRGASLVSLTGALIALAYTTAGRGPFAGSLAYRGDDMLQVQGYAVAMAITGLLIAVLAAGQRSGLRAARDWQTRFEAAIGAHRLIAYEWDPVSGRMEITGDARALLGVPPARLTTLADWLALVAPDARERVSAQFENRSSSGSDRDTDVCAYPLLVPGGEVLDATDEARTIHDHDGELHRVVGIIRVVAPAAA